LPSQRELPVTATLDMRRVMRVDACVANREEGFTELSLASNKLRQSKKALITSTAVERI